MEWINKKGPHLRSLFLFVDDDDDGVVVYTRIHNPLRVVSWVMMVGVKKGNKKKRAKKKKSRTNFPTLIYLVLLCFIINFFGGGRRHGPCMCDDGDGLQEQKKKSE